MTKDRFYCLRQLACNAQNDLELEAKDALAEIEGAHHDITSLMNSLNGEVNEAERLRTELRRLAQEVVDEDRRTVGPEGPSWQLLDLAEKALKGLAHEPDSPHKPDMQKMTNQNDEKPVFVVTQYGTDHQWKIYASGKIEGFPLECWIDNRIPLPCASPEPPAPPSL